MPAGFDFWLTPPGQFFVAARTVISPLLAPAFQGLLEGYAGGNWNNATKLFWASGYPCSAPFLGKRFHLWHGDPIVEGWGTATVCDGVNTTIPDLNIPSDTDYQFTIGDQVPLDILGVYHQLFTWFGTTEAYAFRYGRLWTTVRPPQLTHDYEVIHWDSSPWVP